MYTPLRVLIVENSADDTQILLRMLRAGGYEPIWEQVQTATEMETALYFQHWDFVLSEYELLQFGALDALQILQERGLPLPLFVVTGQSDEEKVAAAMKAGARDYLMKNNLTRLVPAIERELRDARDRHTYHANSTDFHALIESILDLVIVLAADGTVHYTSRSSERILGYKPAVLAGVSLYAYLHAEDEALLRQIIDQASQNTKVATSLKVRLRAADGRWRLLEGSCTAFCESGKAMRLVIHLHDETGKEGSSSVPLHYDVATGLLHRSRFDTELATMVQHAQEKSQPITLFCIDLDRFREINDTFGYRWGDDLLRQIGLRLQKALRRTDLIARLSGDEFAVLLPTIKDATGATKLARRLLQILDSPFVIEGHKVTVGANIGIALCPEHGGDSDTLMRRAAVATYQAKRSGVGYAFYLADLDDHADPSRLVLLSELRHAAETGQFLLHYQPKAEIASGRISQVEALLRWQHPQQGLVLPGHFIPLAEETGVIRQLSQWVLNEATRQCRIWSQTGIALRVAVNLSMRDLQDDTIPYQIASLLETWGVEPSSLEIEITETAIAADAQVTLKTLKELRRMGVCIAIDDFGTGYSSLAHLRRLPVDTIKIDKSFVKGLTSDGNDAAIVRATVQLGHNLGLTIVAEGVEDQETWEALGLLGCDLAQGYYVSHPVSADELQRWLKTSPWQTKLLAAS